MPADSGDLAALICWETDALGSEERVAGEVLEAVFYYPQSSDPARLEKWIRSVCEASGNQPGCLSQGLVEVPPDRWMSTFKEHFKGITVGRFFVHPPWIPRRPGKLNLEIDPSHAFGTGTHESTQLILRELPRRLPGMESLLDIGTGSGILAIGARLLSPSMRIYGIDNDSDAVAAAVRNAGANQTRIHLAAAEPAGVRSGSDVVLANLTRPLLQHLASDLSRLTRRRLITSGFTSDEEILVREAILAGPGWRLSRRTELRGWVCLQFEPI